MIRNLVLTIIGKRRFIHMMIVIIHTHRNLVLTVGKSREGDLQQDAHIGTPIAIIQHHERDPVIKMSLSLDHHTSQVRLVEDHHLAMLGHSSQVRLGEDHHDDPAIQNYRIDRNHTVCLRAVVSPLDVDLSLHIGIGLAHLRVIMIDLIANDRHIPTNHMINIGPHTVRIVTDKNPHTRTPKSTRQPHKGMPTQR